VNDTVGDRDVGSDNHSCSGVAGHDVGSRRVGHEGERRTTSRGVVGSGEESRVYDGSVDDL
jgi:hypothetical protein